MPLLADIQKRLHTLPQRAQNHRPRPADNKQTAAGELTSPRSSGRWHRLGLPAGGDQALLADCGRACRTCMIVCRMPTTRRRRACSNAIAGIRAEIGRRSGRGPAPSARGVDPAPIALADLPPNLCVERYVGRSGKWLLRVFAKDGLWDFGRWSNSPRRCKPSIPEATGKPFGTVEGLMRHERTVCNEPAFTPFS